MTDGPDGPLESRLREEQFPHKWDKAVGLETRLPLEPFVCPSFSDVENDHTDFCSLKITGHPF